MSWTTFFLGFMAGGLSTGIFFCIAAYYFMRPFFVQATKQREEADQVAREWAQKVVAARPRKKSTWGRGNQG